MIRDSRQALGVFMVVIGTLFLLVNNHLLWFGWEALWPVFPLLIGIFLLRVFVTRRKPRQLFTGLFLTMMAIFFFVFSVGLVSWESMDALWPTFPLIIGLSLLALVGVVEESSSALVVGLGFVIFAVVGYFGATGAIQSRMSEPIVRLWPIVLIAAGALVYLRGRREALAAQGTPGTTKREERPEAS